jgi:hypothetical protein
LGTRRGMAADPQWIQRWIQENGPYLYHGASPRYGEDPQAITDSILREGIKPDMRAPEEWPAWTPEEEQQGYRTDENYDELDPELEEAWHNPRPGHTFLTTTPDGAYGPPTFRVDLRKLDPANLNPDDDYMRDMGFPTHYKQTIPPKSLGEQAEEYNWGENPEDTHASFESNGVVAHRGPIPPEAVELHTPPARSSSSSSRDWSPLPRRKGSLADGTVAGGPVLGSHVSAAEDWEIPEHEGDPFDQSQWMKQDRPPQGAPWNTALPPGTCRGCRGEGYFFNPESTHKLPCGFCGGSGIEAMKNEVGLPNPLKGIPQGSDSGLGLEESPLGIDLPASLPTQHRLPMDWYDESPVPLGKPKFGIAERSGIPEVDKLIEDFLKEDVQEYGGLHTVDQLRDPQNSHGMCQAVTEQFVEFAKTRGFKAYVTNTDMDEMGYTPSIEPFGEVGFDESGQMQHGFYPEHTVATIVINDPRYPYGREVYIDFTASQYGYTDHPKVEASSRRATPSPLLRADDGSYGDVEAHGQPDRQSNHDENHWASLVKRACEIAEDDGIDVAGDFLFDRSGDSDLSADFMRQYSMVFAEHPGGDDSSGRDPEQDDEERVHSATKEQPTADSESEDSDGREDQVEAVEVEHESHDDRLAKLTEVVAALASRPAETPGQKRKLVVNRDESGRIASIEEQ